MAIVGLGLIGYVYARLGIGRWWALGLLAASILGAAINVPIARFRGHIEAANTVISVFGVRYLVPAVITTGRTVLAVNVGGAVIPTGLAAYLVVHASLGWRALGAVAIVAVVLNRTARPVRGIGIVVPLLIPPLAAVVSAVVVGGPYQAALAYTAGTLGTLIGADLAKLPHIRKLGAPLVSIGGAGTFDGIFLTGIIAVLLAAG